MSYLANPTHWKNRFDGEWFTDERRKWPARYTLDASISVSPEQTGSIVSHTKTPAALYLKKEGEAFLLRDESGTIISATSGEIAVTYGAALSIPPESGFGPPVQLEPANLYVSFDSEGCKKIQTGNGAALFLDKPFEGVGSALHHGRFFHEIRFDMEEWESYFKNWKNAAPPFINAYNLTQVVIAHDLGLEPGLQVIEGPDVRKIGRRGANESKGKKHGDFRQIWEDAAKNIKYAVTWPRQFFANITKEGFAVRTALDDRDKICAIGPLFEAARSGRSIWIEGAALASQRLFEELHNGSNVSDPAGNTWVYTAFDTNQAIDLARNIRNIFQEVLQMPTQDFLALNYDEQGCVIAVREQDFMRVDLAAKERAQSAAQNNLQRIP